MIIRFLRWLFHRHPTPQPLHMADKGLKIGDRIVVSAGNLTGHTGHIVEGVYNDDGALSIVWAKIDGRREEFQFYTSDLDPEPPLEPGETVWVTDENDHHFAWKGQLTDVRYDRPVAAYHWDEVMRRDVPIMGDWVGVATLDFGGTHTVDFNVNQLARVRE